MMIEYYLIIIIKNIMIIIIKLIDIVLKIRLCIYDIIIIII